MKKELLILGMLFVSVTLCFSQRTLINFEPGGLSAPFTAFGADDWTGDPLFQIIENPDKSGINASDSVAIYLEPNEGEPWMGMFYKPADIGDDNIDFTEHTELCVDVWMAAAGTVTLKAEANTAMLEHEGAPIAVSTTGAWVEVCQDFAGTPVDGQSVETVVLFFNITSVPGTTTEHYFDNIVQLGPTSSVSYIEDSAFEVYPNPVNDVLFYNADFNVDQVIISDMVGKELSRSYGNEQGEVSVAGLPLGVYIISFTDDEGRMGSAKFVKN